jgi:hypothetical protein
VRETCPSADNMARPPYVIRLSWAAIATANKNLRFLVLATRVPILENDILSVPAIPEESPRLSGANRCGLATDHDDLHLRIAVVLVQKRCANRIRTRQRVRRRRRVQRPPPPSPSNSEANFAGNAGPVVALPREPRQRRRCRGAASRAAGRGRSAYADFSP